MRFSATQLFIDIRSSGCGGSRGGRQLFIGKWWGWRSSIHQDKKRTFHTECFHLQHHKCYCYYYYPRETILIPSNCIAIHKIGNYHYCCCCSFVVWVGDSREFFRIICFLQEVLLLLCEWKCCNHQYCYCCCCWCCYLFYQMWMFHTLLLIVVLLLLLLLQRQA